MMTNTLDRSRYARRNWLAFFADYVLFGVGLTFANTNTTLPAFAATLTDSKIVIGAVGAVWIGGWLLPQVFAGNHLSNKPRKYPYLMWSGVLGRPFFWLFVLYLLLGGIRFPALTLGLLFLGLALFAGTDAMAALAWFDMLGKAMPANTRGRLVGVAQTVNGLLAIGAGALVRFLLSDSGPAYPVNYAAIFALAGLCFLASLWACYFIVEFPGEIKERPAAWNELVSHMGEVWRNDPAFARVTGVRLLAGLGGLATPFYVIYATQAAKAPQAAIGSFLAAQTIGGTLAGLGLGLVADRWGSHRVIQIAAGLALLAPGAALALIWSGAPGAIAWVYPLVFIAIGVFEGSIMLGFLNYVLEIAPADSRPTYMGLTNTLAGLLVFMPVLGGWILERTSYPVLFSAALAGVAAAAALSWTLANPRANVRRMVETGGAISPAP